MKTIVNINGELILSALRKAKPITTAGKVAVENYIGYLQSNVLSATALDNSIESLTANSIDVGLKPLIDTLNGVMHKAKRKVAIAYESLQKYKPGDFFYVGTEADQILSDLFTYNAAKIVEQINSGILDKYNTNPVILDLIKWAKSASNSNNKPGVPPLKTAEPVSAETTLLPVMIIGTYEDKALLFVDKDLYVRGDRGALSYVSNVNFLDKVQPEVKKIISCMSMLSFVPNHPTTLILNKEVTAMLKKVINLQSFEIDLLAGIESCFIMNNVPMSSEKAKALLSSYKDSVIAALTFDEGAKEAFKLLMTIFDVFETYRGSLIGSLYAKSYTNSGYTAYLIKDIVPGRYALINKIRGQYESAVVNSTVYDSVYDLLANEYVISNTAVHAAISVDFAKELSNESSKLSIRKQILTKLIDERSEYSNLLKRIKTEEINLQGVLDANPEKQQALSKLSKEVQAKLVILNEEIEKLQK